ncbi:unnamed protein product [Malus baccata var. baccata]
MRREVAKLDASGSYREALYLHAQPVSACPREFTFPPLLKACGKLSSDQLRRHKFYISRQNGVFGRCLLRHGSHRCLHETSFYGRCTEGV